MTREKGTPDRGLEKKPVKIERGDARRFNPQKDAKRCFKKYCAPVSLLKLIFTRHTPVDNPLLTHVTAIMLQLCAAVTHVTAIMLQLCAAVSTDLRGRVVQPALVVDHCSAKPAKTRAMRQHIQTRMSGQRAH